jgi:hypothetical protein
MSMASRLGWPSQGMGQPVQGDRKKGVEQLRLQAVAQGGQMQVARPLGEIDHTDCTGRRKTGATASPEVPHADWTAGSQRCSTPTMNSPVTTMIGSATAVLLVVKRGATHAWLVVAASGYVLDGNGAWA